MAGGPIRPIRTRPVWSRRLLPTDNAGLVHFFHLRERGEPAQGTFDQLIENFGRASASDARQQACADLVAIGTPALPRLRALVREGGRPAALARHCVTAIETDGGTLTSAAARLLAHRRAADASRVLLAYLPHAENDQCSPGHCQESLRDRRPRRKWDRGPSSGQRPERRPPVAAGHGRRPPGRGRPRAASRRPPEAPSSIRRLRPACVRPWFSPKPTIPRPSRP